MQPFNSIAGCMQGSIMTNKNFSGFFKIAVFGLICFFAPFRAFASGSIAILSFENLTNDPEHEWIAIGFSETLTEKLSFLPRLSVMGRRRVSDILRPAGVKQAEVKEDSAEQVGKLLSVDQVITGSVQLSSDLGSSETTVLISARIINARTAQITKTLSISGQTSDIFGMQDELSTRLAEALVGKLSRHEQEFLKRRGTSSLEAYKFYILGNMYLDSEKYATAITMYDNAMSKHPGILYAEAHHNQGTAFLRAGKTKEMLEKFKQDAADLSSVYYDAGIAFERNGEFDRALEAYWTFLRYNDKKTTPWRGNGFQDIKGAPIAWKNSLFILSGTNLNALNAETGKYIWGVTVKKETIGSPAILNEKIYLAAESGEILDFDAATGKNVNSIKISETPQSGAISGGNCLYVVDKAGFLHSIDPVKDGIVWTAKIPGEQPYSITAADGGVIASSSDEMLSFLDKSSGKTLWSINGLRLVGDLKVIAGKNIYVADDSGSIQAIRKTDGSSAWNSEDLFSSSAAIQPGEQFLYVLDQDGGIAALDKINGSLAWRTNAKGGVFYGIEEQNSLLYITSDAGISAFDPETGKFLWRHTLKYKLSSQAVVGKKGLYITLENGEVVALSSSSAETASYEIDAYLRIGRISQLKKDTEEALKIYQYIVDNVKFNCAQAHYEMAALYESMNKKKEAAEANREYKNALD